MCENHQPRSCQRGQNRFELPPNTENLHHLSVWQLLNNLHSQGLLFIRTDSELTLCQQPYPQGICWGKKKKKTNPNQLQLVNIIALRGGNASWRQQEANLRT